MEPPNLVSYKILIMRVLFLNLSFGDILFLVKIVISFESLTFNSNIKGYLLHTGYIQKKKARQSGEAWQALYPVIHSNGIDNETVRR